MPGAPGLPEAVHKEARLCFVELVTECHGLLLEVRTTAGNAVRERLHRGAICESVRFFEELVRQHGEVMIVAKGIREAVSLVRQCRDLAKVNRLQDLELVPQ